MADILLGGTVAPGGPFEQARQENIKGGLHSVADITARDALPSYLREEGMFAWVRSPGTLYTLVGGVANGNWQLAKTATLGALNGISRVEGAQVVWGGPGSGTISAIGAFTTTTNGANQVIATFIIPADTVHGFLVRVQGRDIDTGTPLQGVYHGIINDVWERRAGISGGVPVRQGSAPTPDPEVKTGSLTTVGTPAFDMVQSGDNVDLRVSPGTAQDIKWTWEAIALITAP